MVLFATLLLIAALACVNGTLFFDKGDRPLGSLLLCVSFAIGFVLVCRVAPAHFGVGRVANRVERYDRVLESGVAYDLVAQTSATAQYTAGLLNGSARLVQPETPVHVILVRRSGTEQFYALRVKGVLPPEHFVLVSGEPTALEHRQPLKQKE